MFPGETAGEEPVSWHWWWHMLWHSGYSCVLKAETPFGSGWLPFQLIILFQWQKSSWYLRICWSSWFVVQYLHNTPGMEAKVAPVGCLSKLHYLIDYWGRNLIHDECPPRPRQLCGWCCCSQQGGQPGISLWIDCGATSYLGLFISNYKMQTDSHHGGKKQVEGQN